MEWNREFKNPSAQYRIKPFWFWNGDMKEDEIDYQLKELADKGLGGAFICARQGMNIPYLSDKWFELVQYATERAKKYGIEVWLYDEYPYPSGMGGGEVLLQHPDAEHKVLEHRTMILLDGGNIEEHIGWSEVLFVKAFPIEQGKVDYNKGIDLKNKIGNLQVEEIFQSTGLTKYNNKRFFTSDSEHILIAELPAGNWKIEMYLQEPLGDFKYYGKFFDPCCEEAVKTFLNITHDRYKDFLGSEFGRNVKGMFSDEVGLLSPIPWSSRLPKFFAEKNGYDIIENLPALHDSSYPNAYKIRYDLYNTMHQLFVESYHKQVAEWCQENELEYATEVPSMRMTTQQYSTIIGGDTAHEKLGKSLEWIYDEYIPHYRSNAKAVSSLARQLNRKFAMIESFHSVGWSMTLQDAKWMFDRLAAQGINFYNVHAFYYSTDTLAKHDAPPSQFFQNPYWKHYKLLADYAARLSTWITNTEAEIRVAVLDPVATLWSYLGNPFASFRYEGENEEEKHVCDYIRNMWVETCKQLLFYQIDYDHLDAEILQSAIVNENGIQIGRACYKVLVIPPTKFLEKKAYDKIRAFLGHGGKVICLGELPERLIDSDESIFEDAEFWKRKGCLLISKNMSDKLWCEWCQSEAEIPLGISVNEGEKKDLISSIRSSNGEYYIFLANQGKQQLRVNVNSFRNESIDLKELSLEDGKSMTVYKSTNILLKPYESKLFVVCEAEVQNDFLKNVGKIKICTKGEMPVTIKGKNVLRLEKFKLSNTEGVEVLVPPKTFIEQCVEYPELLSGKNITFSDGFGIPRQMSINYPLEVEYKTNFYMNTLPEDFGLLMDQNALHGEWEIYINGKILDSQEQKKLFVYDKNNILFDICPNVQLGENELAIRMVVKKDSDGLRDPLYLYGDFGVQITEDGRECLTSMPKAAYFDLKTIEHFPYYSGTLCFQTKITVEKLYKDYEVKLDLECDCHDCIEIMINKKSIGVRAFAPYIWQVPEDYFTIGENEVEICVTNTLAAMLDGTWFDYEKHILRKIAE